MPKSKALFSAALAIAATLPGPVAMAQGRTTAGNAAPDPDAPPAFRAYVDGPYGQIHVRVAGPEGGVPMILVHKMVWSSVEFEKALPVLAARGIRAIAVDLPGYGLSDAPDAEPSAAQYADALVPVLDHFGIDRAVMVGANTGATLVTAFALEHPGRTRAIALDGPPIFTGETLQHLLDEPEFDRTPRPHGAALLARWKEIEAMAKGRLSDEAIQTGLLQFFQAGPNYLWGHQAIFKYDLAAALDRVEVPAMVITYPGDQLRNTALQVARDHPDFTLVQIDSRGMTADFEDPALWANAVADYALALRSPVR